MAAIIGMVSRVPLHGQGKQWNEAVGNLKSRTLEAFEARQYAVGDLSVQLSVTGGHYEDGRIVVWLDGQIDNLVDCAQQFGVSQGDPARVIAEMFQQVGFAFLPNLEGEYVIVVIEGDKGRQVHLVRDRYGSKPIYYIRTKDGWAFSSEAKGVVPFCRDCEVDHDAIVESVSYRYLVGDRSLVRHVMQVLPSTVVSLVPGRDVRDRRYWDLSFSRSGEAGSIEESVGGLNGALDRYFSRLRNQVDEVGVLLSGGVDSSILACKAKEFGFKRCVAFTAKWQGDNPELQWAQRVSQHLGMEHRIVPLQDQEIGRQLPWIVYRMEEPPRHYNSFVLAKLFEAAASEVPVVLHGEAADALFGARRLRLMRRAAAFHRWVRCVPKAMQRQLGNVIARPLAPSGKSRLARVASYLRYDTEEYLFSINQINHHGLASVFGVQSGMEKAVNHKYYELSLDDSADWVVRLQKHHLYSMVSNALVHLDRLSSPFAVRVGVPFLSGESVAIGCSLPYEFKVSELDSKPVVKKLACRWLPNEWVYRRKQGFPAPLSQWLKGPLNRWLSILCEDRTRSRGLIDVDALLAADLLRASESLWTAVTLELALRQLVDGDGYAHLDD